MHRQLLRPPSTLLSDHVNGDGLDNRRGNLRVATSSQNGANGDYPKFGGKSRSKYRGVRRGPYAWMAHISTGDRQKYHRQKYLGSFKSEEDAARAYNEAALKQFGEFARLNIIA